MKVGALIGMCSNPISTEIFAITSENGEGCANRCVQAVHRVLTKGAAELRQRSKGSMSFLAFETEQVMFVGQPESDSVSIEMPSDQTL
jgi:hypothetical protein